MSQPVVYKEDSELIEIGWDYAWNLQDGATISNAVITITPSGLNKEGAEIIDGSIVSQKIKSGTKEVIYTVEFEVTTSTPKIYVDKILVKVY